MKKVIIIILVTGAILGVYMLARGFQVELSALQGETVKARRGDLVVPITASGKIEPANIVNIKSEASGTVVETPYVEGQMVAHGDLIVRLDEEDERRSVERADADFLRAQITLDRARISHRQSQEVGVMLAQARLDQAKARYALAEINFEKQKIILDTAPGASAPIEYKSHLQNLEEAKATVKAAEAELVQAHIAVELAGKEVDAAEQTVQTAKKVLEDAQKRLRETEIRAPIDGMVLRRQVQVGEVILSGKTSLVGGTDLMQIADIGDLYAVVNVDEADIGMVHTLAPVSARPGHMQTPQGNPATQSGDSAETSVQTVEFPAGILDEDEQVELTVESFPEEKFYGVIERISPSSEIVQAIATFRVRIRINSPNRDKLAALLNTQVEAQFTVHSLRDVLLVSYDAIKPNPDGEGFGVYVPVQTPGQPRPEPMFKRCRFGPDNAIEVAVLEVLDNEMLKPGDDVYTRLPIKTEKERRQESRR
ncbi:MAG: HlyD family efflux transporter periplasmic adaptor subunit [Phycisphaerales bacterium]|nr:HlyD family efflux transporter periplasmic adaptor subunit [Phycisphaerales bacterium]